VEARGDERLLELDERHFVLEMARGDERLLELDKRHFVL
jgi:hypothetical protein